MKLAITVILILFGFSNLSLLATTEPKERTFIYSGKISDNINNELLVGVNIKVSNCEKTVYSDLNGNFFIQLKVKNNETFKIEFSQIGYQTKTFTNADLLMVSGQLEVNLTQE